MLHTRVACRARTWDVLDERRCEDVTWWWLRQDGDAPRLLATPPDVVTPLATRARRLSRRAWVRTMLARLRGTSPAWWPAASGRLPIDRLPWQCLPAMLLLSGRHRRLLLADPVGMGKTVQAALLLRELHDRDPAAATLVVAPAALLAQWRDELASRACLDAIVIDATRLRAEALLPPRVVDQSRRGASWIVSIDVLRQPDVEPLIARTPWTMLVVDEAHVAAPGTARLSAVRAVAKASARVMLLTGTPTAAGAAGLDALRAVGASRPDAPMAVLRRQSTRPGRPTRTCVLSVDLGAAHAALCARLDAFVDRARVDRGNAGLLPALVLRRRAASCPAALVHSIERRLLVLGTPDDPQHHEQLLPFDDQDALDAQALRLPAWNDDDAERAELGRLIRLARRLPPQGRKAAAVARLLRRCREPAIVFTSYVDTARALRDRLGHRRPVVVHGRQPDALRAQAIEAFTSGQVDTLVTTDASAEGLNLQARCRLVVHADIPASARLLAQRTGRVDRIGQQRRVHEVLVSSRTTEDTEALARVMARASEDSAHLAGHLRNDERRTRLAAAWLSRTVTTRSASPAERADGDHRPAIGPDDIATCTLPPSAWHRLRARWSVPGTATAVQVATLVVPGSTPLASSALRLAVMTARHLSAADVARLVPGQVRRARARARRLDAWHRQAESHARATEARATRHDLFMPTSDPALEDARRIDTALTVRVHGWIGLQSPEDRSS